MIKILFVFTLLAGSVFSLKAQQEMMLHFMPDVQQAGNTNPAFFPREKHHIHFPAPMPSMAINFSSSGFTLAQLYERTDTGPVYTIDNAISNLGKNNLVIFNTYLDYFAFKFSAKNMSFGIGATEKFNFSMKYTGEAGAFYLNGNQQFIDQTINFGPDFKFRHYREFYLSYAINIKEKYAFGVKVKYLNGLGDISTEKNSMTLYTDTENYALTVATDYLINTSGIAGLDTLDDAASGYFFNTENTGMGLDIGATYNLNDKIKLAFSMIDLGFINWDTRVKNLYSNGSYTYYGIDVKELVDPSSGNDSLGLGAAWDSIKAAYEFKESEAAYRTSITPKTYLSGTYKISETSTAGLLIYGDFIGGLNPAVSVSYTKKFGGVLSTGFCYSYKNRSFVNLGTNLIIDGGPMQLFFVTDNILSLLPRHVKNVNFRMGLNWSFGKRKDNSGPAKS